MAVSRFRTSFIRALKTEIRACQHWSVDAHFVVGNMYFVQNGAGEFAIATIAIRREFESFEERTTERE